MTRRALWTVGLALALLALSVGAAAAHAPLSLAADTPSDSPQLAGITATRHGATVRIAWESLSEGDNAGFNVYRSATETSERAWLAFIPARSASKMYEYLDRAAIDPNARYWLESLDGNGEATLHGPLKPAPGAAPNAVTSMKFDAAPITPNVPLYLAALLVMAGGLWFALYRVGRGRT